MFEWAIKYREQFNQSFPIWGIADRSEEGVIALIKECLKKGEPFKPNYEIGKEY